MKVIHLFEKEAADKRRGSRDNTSWAKDYS